MNWLNSWAVAGEGEVGGGEERGEGEGERGDGVVVKGKEDVWCCCC